LWACLVIVRPIASKTTWTQTVPIRGAHASRSKKTTFNGTRRAAPVVKAEPFTSCFSGLLADIRSLLSDSIPAAVVESQYLSQRVCVCWALELSPVDRPFVRL